MKKILFLGFFALLVISLSSCEKGKSCMCYEYDWDSGHEIGMGYYEDRASCSSTETWLGSHTAGYSYFICDEIVE